MRIIAGMAKGMRLAVPRGGATRPTSDRVREAIFSSLGERVVTADVLDLYAGTGALGLEAASRGARSVVFVETAPAALQSLRRNIETFRRGRTISCAFVVCPQLREDSRVFSLIFADPPYGTDVGPLLSVAERVLSLDGMLILETAKRNELEIASPWRVTREAVYGDTKVNFLAVA